MGPGSWLAAWIPPLFIFLAVKRFRNHESGGYIRFKAAFVTGTMTAMSGALLYSLIIYIFGTLIDPAIIDNFKELMLADLEKTEDMMRSMVGDSIYEQSIEEVKKTTLRSIATTDFIYKSFGGGIVSLIVAAILKHKKPEVI